MISDKEIEAKAAEFELRPLEVQKDYIYGWLLKELFERPALATQLVLKGGNALRKGYLPDTRFSKDLDFSAREGILTSGLGGRTSRGMRFRHRSDRSAIYRQDAGSREGPCYSGSTGTGSAPVLQEFLWRGKSQPTHAGLTSRNLTASISPCRRVNCCTDIQIRRRAPPSFNVEKLEEILASKLTTLLHRRNPADLFDLLYTIIFRDQFGVNRREVITTFLRKSIFETQPGAARDQLRAVPVADFSELWKSLVAPVASLFNFNS